MTSTFLVIINNGEHSGHITEADMDDIWSPENEHGWTSQDYCGTHESIWDKCSTKIEAEIKLKENLKCTAAEDGTYCYTHNPQSR